VDASEAGGGERQNIDRSETRSESEPLAFGDRDTDDLDGAIELYLLDRYADGDGTVRVQLLGWERDGDGRTHDGGDRARWRAVRRGAGDAGAGDRVDGVTARTADAPESDGAATPATRPSSTPPRLPRR